MILNDKELEALIREEFSAAAPDNFDIILERIQSAREQKEREPSKRKHTVSNMMKLAWAAVLFLVLGTGIVGYRSTKIPTDVIQIDVNPSVAIEVNRYGDVVSYQGLNKDAAAVLEKEKAEANSPKDLVRGTVLSMIDEGYINKKENAILISVIGNNDKRTQKLEKIAVDAAVSTQKDSGIKLKVYKQHLRNQDTLKELANQYGISEGKAAFIQTIAGVIPEAQIDNLSTMSMSQLSSTVSEHLGDTGKAVEDVTPTEEPKESASPATPGASSTTPGSSNKPGTTTAPQPEETVTLPPKPTPTQTTAPDPTPTPMATIPPAVTEEPAPTSTQAPTPTPEVTTAPTIPPMEEETE